MICEEALQNLEDIDDDGDYGDSVFATLAVTAHFFFLSANSVIPRQILRGKKSQTLTFLDSFRLSGNHFL